MREEVQDINRNYNEFSVMEDNTKYERHFSTLLTNDTQNLKKVHKK